jgi:hypothetical protein
MARSDLLALFFIGLLVAGFVASLQNSPGYMDADYYMAGGLRLVQGHGFSEIILWNYLDDPAGLPHPSHSYWMPLASILAAAGMWLTGQHDFHSARLPFILLAGIVPPLTSLLAYRLTARRNLAWISGLLAAFPAYNIVYLATTDNFVTYAVLGALFFILLPYTSRKALFGLGLVVGLMNFTRSDGLLWLPLSLLALLLKLVDLYGFKLQQWFKQFLLSGSFVLLAYLLVMLPWFARNWIEFGALMPPGGLRAVFLVEYGDTFFYPASQLTFERWLAAGWQAIMEARLIALAWNMGTGFAVQGGILLFPFILVGGWHLRRDLRIKIAGLAWVALFLVMSLVFPFAGSRGGFLHAGVALMPLGWALAPLGLERVVAAVRRRNWFTPQAWHVFSAMLLVINLGLSLLILNLRVINGNWDLSDQDFRQAEARLLASGAQPDAVMMTTNPPGYYIASGRPAIVNPDAALPEILATARAYHARYLMLRVNSTPKSLTPFLEQTQSAPELRLLFSDENTAVYEFVFGD